MPYKPKPEKVPNVHVVDSFLGLTLSPGHRIYAVTYEPMWQKVRLQCSFVDETSIKQSEVLLEAYASSAQSEADAQLHLYRVYNLLCAIPIGQVTIHQISYISKGETNLLLPFRESIESRLDIVGRPTEWDWHTARKQLHVAIQDDPKGMYKAYMNLKKRAYRPGKPELRYYMGLIEEIM